MRKNVGKYEGKVMRRKKRESINGKGENVSGKRGKKGRKIVRGNGLEMREKCRGKSEEKTQRFGKREKYGKRWKREKV